MKNFSKITLLVTILISNSLIVSAGFYPAKAPSAPAPAPATQTDTTNQDANTAVTAPAPATTQTRNSVSLPANVPKTYTPLAPLPNLETMQPETNPNISTYVQDMFNLLIAIGAVAAVFMITWGGFEYMSSDAVSGKSAGKEKIQNAIYGLLMILCSFLILKTIDPRFVNIPAGLVTPLNLATTSSVSLETVQNSNQSIMNKVSATAQSQADSAIYTNNQAQDKVNTLSQQLNDAYDAETVACDKTQPDYTLEGCNNATVLSTKLEDQLNTARATEALTAYNKMSLDALNTINSGGEAGPGVNGPNTNTFQQSDLDSINRAVASENSAYNKALTTAQENDADPTTIQTLQRSHDANSSQLQIQQNLVSSQLDHTLASQNLKNIQNIQAAMDAEFAPDSIQRTQIDNTANVAIDQLKSMQSGRHGKYK